MHVMARCCASRNPLNSAVVFPRQITRESYGMTEVKELVPGGESITVTKNNRWGPTTAGKSRLWKRKSNQVTLFPLFKKTFSLLSGTAMQFIPGVEIIIFSRSSRSRSVFLLVFSVFPHFHRHHHHHLWPSAEQMARAAVTQDAPANGNPHKS